MKKNLVRLLALVLCGLMILGILPLAAFSVEVTEETRQETLPEIPEETAAETEAVTEPVQEAPAQTEPAMETTVPAETEVPELPEEFESLTEEEDSMTNEERFEGYVNSLFFDDHPKAPYSTGAESAGARLTGDEKLAYDALVKVIKQIAAGERSSAQIKLGDTSDCDVYVNFNDSCFMLDRSIVHHALIMDLTYELYWYYPYSGGGYNTSRTDSTITFFFTVDRAYQGSQYVVNTAKTGAAKTAAKNAKAIVAKYDGQSDYHKLVGYKNEIINLVTYDNEASAYGAEMVGGGPWTVVNTFDGNPSTNIVCGGYAVSFQYLCDMSGLTCYYVRGDIPQGFHAWNIVTLDGNNYHVDVCNTDTGTSGADGSYFLAGAPGSVETGYTFTTSTGHKLKYTYYEPDVQLWGKEVLTLSSKSYTYTGCSHKYTSKITTAATETTTGVRTYTCTKCGSSYKETIPKLNHTHSYSKTVTAPTCTEKGYTTYTCKCGDSYVDNYVNAKGHTRVTDPEVNPTCYSKGLTEGAHCGECGKVLTEQKETDMIPHNIVGVTCTYCGLVDNRCGENLYWHFNETTGELTFTGYGEMRMGYNWTDYRDKIRKVTIPQGVTNICEDAFRWCGNLAEVSIPNSVTKIGEDAFAYCESLTEIQLPANLAEIGPDAFFWCNLEEVTIPASMTKIGDRAFQTSRLKKVHIPDSVTEIGKQAFASCNFEEITIPEGVTYIGRWAFDYNKKLKEVNLPGSLKVIDGYAFTECDALETIRIPEGLEEIRDFAFYDCPNLKYAYLPESLERIGEGAFKSCEELITVDMPETMEFIGADAFRWCGSLENITLPKGITSIENGAFFGCRSLKGITIPEGVTKISMNAFSGGCYALEEVILPQSLKVLEGYSFRLCEGLKAIEIPEGITTICEQSFSYCESLTELTIPDSVTAIEVDAFKGSTALKSLTFNAAPPTFDENAFTGLTATIHYPGTPEWTPDLLQNYGGTITWVAEHEYVATSVEATCTEGGSTTFTCTDCGHSFVRDETEATGHRMGIWVVTKEATDTENGEEHRSCLNCSLSESRVIGKNLPGDTDGDLRVTQQDAVYLLWHCAFEDKFPLNREGDLDKNGKVTENDAVYLLWHTLFPELYPIN